MNMSVNSVETKALEKLFKSLYPNIMGFDYDIEFKDYDEPKKIWTDRYKVAEINVDVKGESNIEVFTAGLIRAYVEEMVDSILKYVGVPKNHLYDVHIKTINGIPMVGSDARKLYLSKDIKDSFDALIKKYKDKIVLNYNTFKIELLDNNIVIDTSESIDDLRVEFLIKSKGLKINNSTILFDAFINREEVIERTVNAIDRLFSEYMGTNDFEQDLSNIIETTELMLGNQKFWNYTNFHLVFKPWLLELDGYSPEYYNDSVDITPHFNEVMDAVYSYKESGFKNKEEI